MNAKSLFERIEDKTKPPVLIAEAADTHFGSLESAFKIIEECSKAGVDFVKFQHHIVEEEMLRSTPSASNMKEPLYDFLSKNSLTIHEHARLAEYASSKGIEYLCTPFSLTAAKELKQFINPVAYKIGSGEMLDFPTISKVMEFGSPMLISTGMSTKDEVIELYQLVEDHSAGVVLMSCGSAYPPSPEEINLKFLEEMKILFPKTYLGFSDHSPTTVSAIAAAAMGARVIEKHIQLDSSKAGPDSEVSLSIEQISELVSGLNFVTKALNGKKIIHPNEWETRIWSHRSIVYLRDLPSGHTVGEEDVWSKRPGNGIPARQMSGVVGKRLAKNVEGNTQVEWGDFST